METWVPGEFRKLRLKLKRNPRVMKHDHNNSAKPPSERSDQRISRRRIVIAVAVTASIYVATYVLLSTLGGYKVRWSGKRRYASGFAVADTAYWMPLGIEMWPRIDVFGKHVIEGNGLGELFTPLVWFDQSFVHPSYDLFESQKAWPSQ